VRFREHRHNLQRGLLEKSKLAQRAYEGGHTVGFWKLKVTAGIENKGIRLLNQSNQPTQSENVSHLDPRHQQ
jgi:hypothetical protein